MLIALAISLFNLVYIVILITVESALGKALRHLPIRLVKPQHRGVTDEMPYATPSPSNSPSTVTSTIISSPPRSGSSTPMRPSATISTATTPAGLPRRNHVRSFSTDAVAATTSSPSDTSGHIFVHPATPQATEKMAPVKLVDDSPCISPTTPVVRSRRAKRANFIDLEAPKTVDFGSFSLSSSSASSSLSSPVSHPIDAMEFGSSFVNKRPLHQKARSEMAMRLDMDDFELGAEPHFNTPMLRKKSGELVRSSLKHSDHSRSASTPTSRAKSCPSTPGGTKNVHFDSHLEHVKHFLAQQKPTAVSRDGSPVETETEGEEEFPFPSMDPADLGRVMLVMHNFPRAPDVEGKSKDVYLRSLDFTPDGKSLRGVVQVKNLAFGKSIAIRFTFDAWQTVSEVSAEYVESVSQSNCDRFAFHIKLLDLLARIEEKTMYLAVRYTCDGNEIWDNNGGANYQFGFKRIKTAGTPAQVSAAASAAQAAGSKAASEAYKWSVTTSGQASERMTELRAKLDRLVGDDLGVAPPITFKQSANHGSNTSSNNGFSSRYDFGSSLKEAVKASPRGSPLESPQALKRAYAIPSTFIGGMPATSSNDVSPVSGRGKELPSFVGPCVVTSPPCPSSPLHNQTPLDDDTLAAFPHAAKLAAQPQQGLLPQHTVNQTHKPGTRFFSFPPTRPGIPSLYANGSAAVASNALSYLTPPSSYPPGSPNTSRGGTPTDSPVSRSPVSQSPPRCYSPVLAAPVHLAPGRGIRSPSPSESGPSSPESPPQGSPAGRSPRSFLFEGNKGHNRPDMGSQSYGDFLQSFCWGGALGLTTSAGEPLAALSYESRIAPQPWSAAAIVTPRATSPLPMAAELLEAANNFGRTTSPLIQHVGKHAIS